MLLKYYVKTPVCLKINNFHFSNLLIIFLFQALVPSKLAQMSVISSNKTTIPPTAAIQTPASLEESSPPLAMKISHKEGPLGGPVIGPPEECPLGGPVIITRSVGGFDSDLIAPPPDYCVPLSESLVEKERNKVSTCDKMLVVRREEQSAFGLAILLRGHTGYSDTRQLRKLSLGDGSAKCLFPANQVSDVPIDKRKYAGKYIFLKKLEQYASFLAKELVNEGVLLSSTMAWNIKCSGQCVREQCRQEYYQSLFKGDNSGSLSSSRGSGSVIGRSSMAVTLSTGGSPGLCWTPELESNRDLKDESKTSEMCHIPAYEFSKTISTNTSPPVAQHVNELAIEARRILSSKSSSFGSLLHFASSPSPQQPSNALFTSHTFPRNKEFASPCDGKISFAVAKSGSIQKVKTVGCSSDEAPHNNPTKNGTAESSSQKKKHGKSRRKHSSGSRLKKRSACRPVDGCGRPRLWVKKSGTNDVYSQPIDSINDVILQPKAMMARQKEKATISSGLPILNASAMGTETVISNNGFANVDSVRVSKTSADSVRVSKTSPSQNKRSRNCSKSKKFGLTRRQVASSSFETAREIAGNSPCDVRVPSLLGPSRTMTQHLDGKQSVASDPINPSSSKSFHGSDNTIRSEEIQRDTTKFRSSRKDRHENGKFCRLLPFSALKSCQRKEHSSESRDGMYVASCNAAGNGKTSGGKRGQSLFSNLRNSLMSLFNLGKSRQPRESVNANSGEFSSNSFETSSSSEDVLENKVESQVDLLNHSNYSAFTSAVNRPVIVSRPTNEATPTLRDKESLDGSVVELHDGGLPLPSGGENDSRAPFSPVVHPPPIPPPLPSTVLSAVAPHPSTAPPPLPPPREPSDEWQVPPLAVPVSAVACGCDASQGCDSCGKGGPENSASEGGHLSSMIEKVKDVSVCAFIKFLFFINFLRIFEFVLSFISKNIFLIIIC